MSSLQEHVDSNRDPKEATRSALLDAIAESAKTLGQKANAASAAEGLKNLAEAYAWITYPNNSH